MFTLLEIAEPSNNLEIANHFHTQEFLQIEFHIENRMRPHIVDNI